MEGKELTGDPALDLQILAARIGNKTGGPAFPTELAGGMTLRDYFAAKAMEAWVNGMINTCAEVKEAFSGGIDAPQQVASFAYIMADAMLKVRGGE